MGMALIVIKWILGYVKSSSLEMLINVSPSHLFCASRGLWQGCPISPFLFLLVVEGLSKLVCATRDSSELKGVKVSLLKKLVHLLFVDDVFLFKEGMLQGFHVLNCILSIRTILSMSFKKQYEGKSNEVVYLMFERFNFKVYSPLQNWQCQSIFWNL